MRPDKQLASLLGINDASSVQTDAYLLVNTAQAPGAGIVDQTIQYHGPADLYTLNGASAIASIYSNPTQVTSNPAVTLHSVGTNGGQAAAFTFDLAQSIYDYVNLDEAAIPQTRELRRLLGNMILSMVADRGQPTRFWMDQDAMVRRLIGSLVEVGRGRASVEDFARLIENPRSQSPLVLARVTAPPSGLFLESVDY